MLKIKERFQRLLQLAKNLFREFPATMLIVVLATLTLTIYVDTIGSEKILRVILLFLLSYFAGTFFTESFWKERKWKLASYVVTGGIALFFAVLIGDVGTNLEFWSVFYIGYIVVLMLMAIYFILKNSKLSFQEYLTRVFSNLFFLSIVYAVLAIGVTLLCMIIGELLLDGIYGDFTLRVHILLLGLYYATGCVYAVSNVKEKSINDFVKILIKYVLLPLVSIATVVIYLYILKIIINQEMPSNVIFRICAGLFVVAFPTWNMLEIATTNEGTKKISTIFSYAYLPLLLLEIYSLSVRIGTLGMTPTRYVGIVFIAFQLLALILNFFWKKEKLPKLFVCAAILVAIVTMTPLTPSKVSAMNQMSRLVKNLPEGIEFKDLSIEAKEKVRSAYRYLNYSDEEKQIPEYIVSQKDEILAYTVVTNRNGGKEYYSFYSDDTVIVTDYRTITKVEYRNPDRFSGRDLPGVISYEGESSNNFFSNHNEYYIEEDLLEEYLLSLVAKVDIEKSYYTENTDPYLNIGEGRLMYFTEIHFFYGDGSFSELEMEGYVLE
ncbi:MAG: DUF4153 domain-containing protein [Clostridia bacterium]|nr:DUF4153 domain-containing protein [Clostridia bacterium]